MNKFYLRREEEEDILRLLLEHASGEESLQEAFLQKKLVLPQKELSALLSELKARGLLRETGTGLSLTPTGIRIARDLLDRHETAERFFMEVLGEPLSSAHAAAEQLEHAISQQALKELKEALRRTQGAVLLSDLSPGDEGTLIAIKDPGEKTFARMMGIGLYPGTKLRVAGKMPNGSMIVEINGVKVAVAAEIARAVFVRRENSSEDDRSRRPTELG